MSNTLQQRINRHQLLSELRIKLLRLHKLLLDAERDAYQQVWGQVSRGQLLQLVIHHEQFAWLHRLSEMIVQIDELLQSDEPLTTEAIAELITDVRSLLSPGELGDEFAVKYDAALQGNPDVVMAHAEVVRLLVVDA